MSTRCRIGIVLSDGKVKSIYCHHNGSPEGVGKTLKEYYNDPKKIEDLLELGDISSLGTHYDKNLAKLWEKPYSELSDEQKKALEANTLPYSDRGENVPARVDENIYEFTSKLGHCCEEYTYLFEKDYSGVYRWEMCETPYFKEF